MQCKSISADFILGNSCELFSKDYREAALHEELPNQTVSSSVLDLLLLYQSELTVFSMLVSLLLIFQDVSTQSCAVVSVEEGYPAFRHIVSLN